MGDPIDSIDQVAVNPWLALLGGPSQLVPVGKWVTTDARLPVLGENGDAHLGKQPRWCVGSSKTVPISEHVQTQVGNLTGTIH